MNLLRNRNVIVPGLVVVALLLNFNGAPIYMSVVVIVLAWSLSLTEYSLTFRVVNAAVPLACFAVLNFLREPLLRDGVKVVLALYALGSLALLVATPLRFVGALSSAMLEERQRVRELGDCEVALGHSWASASRSDFPSAWHYAVYRFFFGKYRKAPGGQA